MIEEQKKNESRKDDIPLEQHHELFMSCTSTKKTYQDEDYENVYSVIVGRDICHKWRNSRCCVLFMDGLPEKEVLSSSQIDKYAGEIPNNIVKSTPTEIVTKNYIFKKHCPSNPIDLSQVEWVYRKRIHDE